VSPSTCEWTKLPDGTNVLVRRSRRVERCSTGCGNRSTRECDYPTPKGSCDAPLCASCARRVAPGVDHCPSHPIAQQALALGGA